jgi:phage terminase large subunit
MRPAAATLKRWRENPLTFFYEELRFDPDEPWQEEFIRKLPSQDPREKQIALKACTGPGKSAIVAGAALWFVGCWGGTEKQPCGAITSIDQANLKSGVWKEIAKWRDRSEYMKTAFELTSERLFAKAFPKTWYMEARNWAKRADPETQGRAMSGIHGPYVMMILDEAGDMPPPLLRIAQQIFSSQHDYAKILIPGNPTSLSGVLHQACVTEADRTYSISITADPDDPKRARRTDIDNARAQIQKYGPTNPWVMATILGLFPPASITQLISIEEVETAMKRDYRKDAYESTEKRLGVDCARFGDDSTTICPRQGVVWMPPVDPPLRGVRTNVIAGRIVQECHQWEPGDPASIRIMIDQTGGWGQGTVDQLLLAKLNPMELVYSTPSPDPMFYNLRAYQNFQMADHIRKAAAIPDIPSTQVLKRELTAMTYSLREGKLIIEDKALIKKRLGYSPDHADGYAATYAMPDMPARTGLALLQQQTSTGDFDPYREQVFRS